MDENEIIQIRKTLLFQMQLAEKRLKSASFILEEDTNVDAIPLLLKAVDITVRVLLAFKQKPLEDFQKNIKSLDEEFRKEGLCDAETVKFFLSLYEMNENYMTKIELEYDDRTLKDTFKRANDFLRRTHKFLRTQLITQKERMMKRRIKKILPATGMSICAFIIVILLIKLGVNIFSPQHGLLAYYYNNSGLEGTAAVVRIDEEIDFDWRASRPHSQLTDEFSVRWVGKIKIDKNDNYTLTILSDEDFRLFLNDETLIDTWSNKAKKMENAADIYLNKGFHNVKLEYSFKQRHASLKFLWSSSSFKKRQVRKKILYPPPEYESKLSD